MCRALNIEARSRDANSRTQRRDRPIPQDLLHDRIDVRNLNVVGEVGEVAETEGSIDGGLALTLHLGVGGHHEDEGREGGDGLEGR